MPAFLYVLASWMLAGIVARVLVGAGIAIASFVAIKAAIEASLDGLQSTFSTLGAAGQMLALMGLGDFLSIVGSALVTAASFAAARIVLVRGG